MRGRASQCGNGELLIPYRSSIAARVGTAAQHAVPPVDHDAVRVTGHFVPGAPAVDRVAALRQRIDRSFGEAALDMQRITRLAEREAAGQEPRYLDRFLNVETEIDHRRIELHLDLRLAVRAHATQHAPELA